MENENQDIELNIELQELKKKLELVKQNEGYEIEDVVQVNTCCSKTSKSFLNYISKLIISIITILFCIYMVLISEPGNDNSIYFSILSSVTSSYITQTHTERKD